MNRQRIIYLLATVALICGVCKNSSAQSQYDVIVGSNFSPTIKYAQEKIMQKAQIKDTTTIDKSISYQVTPPAYMYLLSPEPINAPKIGRDQITRLYRNYIKFGVGNYWTPYLDFQAGSLRSTKYAFGVGVFHHSSWGKIKGYAPASFSDTRINVHGQKFFKNYILEGEIGYSHLLVHNYGFQPDSIFAKEEGEKKVKIKGSDIDRQYHHTFADVVYKSNAPAEKHKFNQVYAIGYDFLADNNKKTYEHQFDAKISMDKDVKMKKSICMNFGGNINVDYLHNRWQNTNLTDRWLIGVNPHASLSYKEYFFKVGFNIVTSTQGKDVKFNFLPDIEARLHIVPNVFSIYAGFDGKVEQLSYSDVIQENPYLSDKINLDLVEQKSRIYLGLQTGLSRSLTLGAGASFAFYGKMPFFIPDTNQMFSYKDTTVALQNSFNLMYAKTKVFNAYLNLSYKYKDVLHLGVDANYYYYFLSEDLIQAWYKPALVTSFNANYILLKKFVFKLDFTIQAFAHYPIFINGNVEDKKMKPVLDFDFGFEYLWSKRLSFFADFNNFPCQRNRIYQDYPNQRINILIGVKYTFGGEAVSK